jgi:serine/threonine protein kinase
MEYENQAGKIAARINTIKDDSAFNVLCKDLISKMLIFAPNNRMSIAQIQEHPFSWSAEKMTKLIVDVSKLTEKGPKFISFLLKGSKKVINGDWTLKLERDVLQTLQEIRQTYQTSNGLNQDDLKGSSILSLVKQLRNLHVHASNDKLVRIMGNNDEDFMKYWNDKFPLLICHLYKSKLDYESSRS